MNSTVLVLYILYGLAEWIQRTRIKGKAVNLGLRRNILCNNPHTTKSLRKNNYHTINTNTADNYYVKINTFLE
jgi:hypothetical protein